MSGKEIFGIDRYGGSTRRICWEVVHGHVEISIEGSDGGGAALLTPSQVKNMADHLTRAADAADVGGSVVGYD